MREILLYGFAVLLAVAGFGISVVLPISVWHRRRKKALGLYDEFMEASVDVIGFRYRRTKMPFGDGFADEYAGEVGSLSFRLGVEIVPHRKRHGYRLRLEKRVGGEPIVHVRASQAGPSDPDPLAIVAKTLRRLHAKRERCLVMEEAN
jgi:hypothetical protein